MPYASANGVCVEKIARALVAQGHDVSCLAMTRYDDAGYSEIDGVKVYRIKNLWHMRLLDWCDTHASFLGVKFVHGFALWSWRIKRILLFPIWPLSAPLFAWKFYRQAKQICMSENIDCVVGVYQPFEWILASALLKQSNANLKVAAYFCDCFSGVVFPRILPKSLCYAQLKLWEHYFFDTIDALFVLKSHELYYLNLLGKSINVQKLHCVDIPFLEKVFTEPLKTTVQSKSNFMLVYTGNIFLPLTNPTYLLKLLEFIKGIQVNVHIYGRNNCSELLNHHASNNLKGRLFIHQALPHAEILHLLSESDVLINLGSNNPRQIPSKFFEYMSFGKPIISFYSYDEEPSLPYLRKYPLALLIEEDMNKIEYNARLVEEFIQKNVDKSVPFNTVKSLFPNNTPEYTAELLMKLCNKKANDE